MKKILLSILFFVIIIFGCKPKKDILTQKHSGTPKTDEVESRSVYTGEEKTGKVEVIKENLSLNPDKVYANDTERYIDIYKEAAREEMRLYGIPASITLAQGILESASGKGKLSVEANNHFGIKCHDWAGDKIYHDDDEKQECFRKYKYAKYSFRDHSLFLSGRKRYSELFKLKQGDYEGWAKGLKSAGYATDPKYPNKLISLIERYGLSKYDENIKKQLKPNIEQLKKKINNKKYSLAVRDTLFYMDNDGKSTRKKFTTGKHIVGKDDTMYAISRKHNITVGELLKFNNLRTTALKTGQILIVNEALYLKLNNSKPKETSEVSVTEKIESNKVPTKAISTPIQTDNIESEEVSKGIAAIANTEEIKGKEVAQEVTTESISSPIQTDNIESEEVSKGIATIANTEEIKGKEVAEEVTTESISSPIQTDNIESEELSKGIATIANTEEIKGKEVAQEVTTESISSPIQTDNIESEELSKGIATIANTEEIKGKEISEEVTTESISTPIQTDNKESQETSKGIATMANTEEIKGKEVAEEVATESVSTPIQIDNIESEETSKRIASVANTEQIKGKEVAEEFTPKNIRNTKNSNELDLNRNITDNNNSKPKTDDIVISESIKENKTIITSDKIHYIVSSEDTMYSISKMHGMTVGELQKLNNIKGTTINIGQKLIVNKSLLLKSRKPNNNSYTSYVVSKGDSMYSISKDHDMSVNELQSLNDIKGITIHVGQKLIVKKSSTTKYNKETQEDWTPKVKTTKNIKTQTYIVERGDTMYSISKKYGMTVGELQSINKLKGTTLIVGQKLMVYKSKSLKTKSRKATSNLIDVMDSTPVEKSSEYIGTNDSYTTHIVAKGETMFSITKKYNMTLSELKSLNDLGGISISIGQVLIVKSPQQ